MPSPTRPMPIIFWTIYRAYRKRWTTFEVATKAGRAAIDWLHPVFWNVLYNYDVVISPLHALVVASAFFGTERLRWISGRGRQTLERLGK